MITEQGQNRVYDADECVVFLKTNEAFGGLSNMAGGFPLDVNGLHILTAEALYQACRFPHLPEVQLVIIAQKSPMTAKMKSKPHRKDSRPDWDRVRVNIMRWCLRVKLAQNWAKFGDLLLATEERPIVEESRKDDFWGAKRLEPHTLVGRNVLGRLLMELREDIKHGSVDRTTQVAPLAIPDFLLNTRPIEMVSTDAATAPRQASEVYAMPEASPAKKAQTSPQAVQASLFEQSTLSVSPSQGLDDAVAPSSLTTHDLAPYPAYMDSGVPWLGDVPAHWRVVPIGRIGRLFKGNGGNKDDEVPSGVPCIRYGDLYTRHEFFIRTTRAYVTPERATAYTALRYGDVLFAASGETFEDIGRSAVNLMKTAACCGGDVLLLRPSIEVNPQYLGYAADSPPSRYQKSFMGRGFTIVHVYASQLKGLVLPLPPLAEQAAIVRFLDHADRRIRRYIRAKQRLIALLNEQKQAIVNHAVTRGIDPAVLLKPSGVEWPGDIPANWEIAPLKRIARVQGGFAFKSDQFTDEGVPVVRMSNLKYGTLDLTNVVRIQESQCLRNFALKPGDLLIGMSGSLGDGLSGSVGNFGLVGEEAIPSQLNQRVGRFLPVGNRTTTAYLRLLVQAPGFSDQIRLLSSGTAQFNVSPLDIERVLIAVPPYEEQGAIIQNVENSLAVVNVSISAVQREIALLREYRTRLIADVVTGKLDVRAVAATLPDEVADLAPPDDADDLVADTDNSDGDDLDATPEEADA